MAGGALPPPPPNNNNNNNNKKYRKRGRKRDGDEKEIMGSPSYATTLGELTNWPHKRGGRIRGGRGGASLYTLRLCICRVGN